MSRYKDEPLDLSAVSTYPLDSRPSKVTAADFARPLDPESNVSQFLDTLPNILAAREIKELAMRLSLVTLGEEKNPRASSQKIQSAWTELRQKFSSQELHGISKRIQDERLRSHA